MQQNDVSRPSRSSQQLLIRRPDEFERLNGERRLLLRVLWMSGLVAILLLGLHFGLAALKWRVERYYDAYTWFELSLMACFSSAVCLVLLKLRSSVVFTAFQCVGQMTLTNYLVQNAIALLLFSGCGLGLLHRVSYSFCIGAAVSVFGAQIWFSRWWLSSHRWGPVEWLWRSLTYGKWVANRGSNLVAG